MTNYERFNKELIKIIAFGDALAVDKNTNTPMRCSRIANCDRCKFYKKDGICVGDRTEWLITEYKEEPKLTKQEHALCVAVGTGYIARDKDDMFFLYLDKPGKLKDAWYANGTIVKLPFPHLKFDFIKWTDVEPWSVEDLLKLEVIENE